MLWNWWCLGDVGVTFLEVVHMFDPAYRADGAPAMVTFLVFAAHMFDATEVVVLGRC